MSTIDVITIDGPVSSGKSSVGYLFSQRINRIFVDSGLFYRLGTYFALQKNLDLADESQLLGLFKDLKIDFIDVNNHSHILVNGEDFTDRIKSREISINTSAFAPHFKVRQEVNELQHILAEKNLSVIAGRDCGSEVFPQAKLKFFIDAPVEERAMRRFREQVKTNPSLTLEKVIEETKNRDSKDSDREHGKMIIPENAFVIQNYNKSISEVVEEMVNIYKSVYQ